MSRIARCDTWVRAAVTLGLACGALPGSVRATEVFVPSQYPDIQTAIDHCVNGDTVTVADGTYTGANNRDIDLRGKTITVRSANGPEACIIDCLQGGRGFFLHNGEPASALIEGFTIKHARPVGTEFSGGAIACFTGSATIDNCYLLDNAAGQGAGVYVDWGSVVGPTVTNCVISNNIADPNAFGSAGVARGGGGVCCLALGGTFRNCTITGNAVTGAYNYSYGGGIVNRGGVFVDCRITGNRAAFGGGIAGGGHFVACLIEDNEADFDGGGLYAIQYSGAAYPELADCAVTGNSAGWYGGGVCCVVSNVDLYSSTLAGNTSGYYGGGLYCYSHASTDIRNSILSANTAPFGNELALEGQSNAQVMYSDVYGNAAVYVSGSSYVAWLDGSIFTDPQFRDPNGGDYHVQSSSPCVDHGNAELLPADTYDLDADGDTVEKLPLDAQGNPREVRFALDMGAYEIPFGDLNCDGHIDFGDINPFVLALSNPDGYHTAFPNCPIMNGDIDGDGNVDFGDLNPFVALLVGG